MKSIFLSLILFVTVVHAKPQAQPIIKVLDEPNAEVLWWRPQAVLFTDFDCRLAETPKSIKDDKFLRSSIDTTRFEVIRSGRLRILIPQFMAESNSQGAVLEQTGFQLIRKEVLQLSGNKLIDQVQVYEKEVEVGETYAFGEWVVVLGFEDALDAINRTRAADHKPFEVYPANIPNTSILFVDQAKDNRSGHGGITLTECANEDILAFYSVTWAETWNGHSVAGWSQYRRSTDGGQTWGDPMIFEPSKQMWDGREVFSGLVFSVLTAPNGTLVATVVRYANAWWEKQLAPVYYLSHDHGETWEGPHTLDDSATVDDISMTLSTHFVYNDEIFIVFRGGPSNMSPGGPHTLWVSSDNGISFQQRSVLPFNDADYYWAAGVLDKGEIIVYTYNDHHQRNDQTAEQNIPYVISQDGGYTWSEVQTTHFAKGIRNMQMSGKLGDSYFIQGRSGSYRRDLTGDDPGPGNLVLYSSKNGINWDEGIVLMSRMQTLGSGDCYSDSEIIGKYNSNTPERLLILVDIGYHGPLTNMHYYWVGTSPGALNFLHNLED